MMRRAARSLVAGCLLLTALTAAQAASADGPTDLHAPPDAVQVLPQPPAAGDVLSLKVTARNGSTRPVFNVQARVFLRRNGQDTRLAGSHVNVVTAALFSDVFGYAWRNRRRIRLYAGYQYEGYGDAAGPVAGVPVASAHRFLLQLTAQGLFRAF
jgi:hypothetical protein